jgi:hypothetical protein
MGGHKYFFNEEFVHISTNGTVSAGVIFICNYKD